MTYFIAGRGPGVFRKILVSGLLLAGVSALNITLASQPHGAEKLTQSDSLSLSSLLDITLKRHPQAGVLAAWSEISDAETK